MTAVAGPPPERRLLMKAPQAAAQYAENPAVRRPVPQPPPTAVLVARRHLMTHLGPPLSVVELRGNCRSDSAIAKLEIATFGLKGQPTVVVATCGASQVRPPEGPRAEYFFIVRDLR